MRQIVQVTGDVKEVIEEGLSLEVALSRLEMYNEMDKDDDTVRYYIDYEDKNLNLPQWELDWIEKCVQEDAQERERISRARRDAGLPVFDWEEDYDDFDEDNDEQFYAEFKPDYYDTFED